jgi:two-component system, chemotaxis family, response regulator Rcp1
MSNRADASRRDACSAGEGLIEILMVEDDASDVRLTAEAFKKLGLPNNMRSVGDGVEALAFLRREGKYAGAPRPDIVLLDLNLPKKDGREVLAEIKSDPALKDIPVIVLTGSQADQDILTSYRYHANCFVTKPVNMEQFLEVIRFVRDAWLKPQAPT